MFSGQVEIGIDGLVSMAAAINTRKMGLQPSISKNTAKLLFF